MMSGARLYFRVDWLEQLGLSEPTTTDELYEVLKAVKESDMNGNGEADEYPFYGMALGNFLFNMSGSWGLMNRGQSGQTNRNVDVDEDTGELRFIKADPMYREMLKYVNKLYTEELINYDIFTWSWGRVQSNMLLGLVGAYGGWATTALTDTIDFTGFNAMEGPFGDRLYSAMGSPAEPRFMAVITDTNPYPEATMRWLDYMYSDEAAVLLNMGVEDVSYTVDGGNYVFTDLINDNPEGLSQSEARNLYFPSVSGWLGVVKQELFFGSESSTTALAATAKTAPYHVDVWPELTFTTAENEVIRGIGADLLTYADESRAQFIMGELDLYDDAVWEDYLATLTRIGLDEYMSVCRSAVARLGLK
jgi:putative aldouronate transport system substrate-binding protein